MTDANDVVSILMQDHQEVRQLLTKIASGTGKAKEEAFHQLVYELARHETAEEEVVYPALRRLDGGEKVADARIKEEEDANRVLADLEKLEVGGAEFDKLFEKLRTAVVAHAEAEEAEVFPRLRQGSDADKLQTMGRVLDMAKKTAPTHPHPNVPGTATANLLAGPLAAVVDRTRDAIREARQKLAG
ncbi:MAG TPA: hemerythrin domain-containing protein [Acidimicrobiales bacterium]|nr:hemerythrin domain-containing protein [Acidimicrobiales bacterium]